VTRVLIVGGGTGGTMLANALDKRRFEVTVLSASPDHVFQPALLYIAFAKAKPNIARSESGLLGRGVRFLQASATHVDLRNRVVTTSSGTRLTYDAVVLATGIRTDPSQTPGLAQINDEVGDYHTNVSQAQKLWRSLDAFAGGTIALGQAAPVCKCPPSPVEGMLLADRLLRRRGLREKSKLVFFTPYPRAYPAEATNDVVAAQFERCGIETRTFFDVDRIDATARSIVSIEGETISYDLPIVIPPFIGANIAYDPPECVDADRFVIVDKETLQVKGVDSAFAIGDGAGVPTSKAGVGAHLEAQVVARRLGGLPVTFDGRTNCPLDLGDGRGMFVVGSFEAPVQRYRPSRISRMMKATMGKIYWMSLRGTLEPLFRLYFAITKPTKPAG